MSPTNRVKVLEVMPDFLIEICMDKLPQLTRVVANPLPNDARLVRCGISAWGMVYLIIESDTWDEVPRNGPIPRLEPPLFETVRLP